MKSIRVLLTPAVIAVSLTLSAVPWVHRATAEERDAASQGVQFQAQALPDATSQATVRRVQPGLDHIASWISSVGASVGAFDLRGQGWSGDACLTDPRDDKVRVFPIPGSSGKGYETFELTPTGLRYDSTMAPIGCVPSDINQDGRPDVIVYYWGRSPVLFINHSGAGAAPTAQMFTPQELVAPMQVWNTTALNVADVDGNGALDVLVGNYFPDGARVLDPAASDDPRMQMQHSMGDAANAGVNRLYLGSKSDDSTSAPTFVDASVSLPTRSAQSWTLAFGAQDLTGNGLPDLYVANDFGPDQLLVNESTPGQVRLTAVGGRRNFVTAKSKVLGNDSFKGMGVVFSYEPEAKLPRIFVSNITSPWALQESNFAFYPKGSGSDLLRGEVPYKDESSARGFAQSGWSWDIKAIDPTNSGSDSLVQATGFVRGAKRAWPRLQETAMQNDQLLSTPGAWLNLDPDDGLSGEEPDRMWAPTPAGGFVDIGQAVGFKSGQISRGIAVSDINGDGRDDFLVARQWERSFAYINTSTSLNPWISVNLVRGAEAGTTPVVGATVTVRSGSYTKTSQLYPANGHSGVSGTNLHFALPGHKVGDPVTVDATWRDATGLHKRTFETETGNQELRIDK